MQVNTGIQGLPPQGPVRPNGPEDGGAASAAAPVCPRTPRRMHGCQATGLPAFQKDARSANHSPVDCACRGLLLLPVLVKHSAPRSKHHVPHTCKCAGQGRLCEGDFARVWVAR